MTLKQCKNCKKVVEIKKTTKEEFGTEYISYSCPNCGYVEKTTINHVHYGNDEYK